MSKFRIGDIVRVVKYSNEYNSWADQMHDFIGKSGIIVNTDDGYPTVTVWDDDDDPETYYYEDEALDIELDPERILDITNKIIAYNIRIEYPTP